MLLNAKTQESASPNFIDFNSDNCSFQKYINNLYESVKFIHFETCCKNDENIKARCLSVIRNILCLTWTYEMAFTQISKQDALSALDAATVLMTTIARHMYELERAIDP